MQNLILKAVKVDVDFRYTEFGIYNRFKRTNFYKGDPDTDECYLLISKTGNQMLFVKHVGYLHTHLQRGKKTRKLIHSERWRLDGGSFNPLMIQNYANNHGIQLLDQNKEPYKKFEELLGYVTIESS